MYFDINFHAFQIQVMKYTLSSKLWKDNIFITLAKKNGL